MFDCSVRSVLPAYICPPTIHLTSCGIHLSSYGIHLPPLVYTCLPVVYTCLPAVYTWPPMVYTYPPVVYTCLPVVYTCLPVVYTCLPVVYTWSSPRPLPVEKHLKMTILMSRPSWIQILFIIRITCRVSISCRRSSPDWTSAGVKGQITACFYLYRLIRLNSDKNRCDVSPWRWRWCCLPEGRGFGRTVWEEQRWSWRRNTTIKDRREISLYLQSELNMITGK